MGVPEVGAKTEVQDEAWNRWLGSEAYYCKTCLIVFLDALTGYGLEKDEPRFEESP